MSVKRRKMLAKPLKEWSDDEILELVAKVNKAKYTKSAQEIITEHMSRGTYARALRRVGLRKAKVKAEPAGDGCICQRTIVVRDLVLGLLSALNIPLKA